MPSSYESNQSKQCATELRQCRQKIEKSQSDPEQVDFDIKPQGKNNQVCNSVGKIISSLESEKSHLKISKDNFNDKPRELFQAQNESQCFTRSDLENEKADDLLDTKATAEVENPNELESNIVYKDKEAIRDMEYAYSEDDKTSSKDDSAVDDDDDDEKDVAEDDKDVDDKDEDDPSKTANESGTTDNYAPAEKLQGSNVGRDDSEIPMGEPNECTSPVDEAKLIMAVVSETETEFKGPSESVYPSLTTIKNPNNFLPDFSTVDFLSLNASVNIPTNDNQVDEPPREEQTLKADSMTTIVVSQLSTHPENAIDTGATMLPPIQDIKNLQLQVTIHPFFSSLAGPAGESLMESSSPDNLELEDDNDDNVHDTETSEGSVLAKATFQSGSADAFDPDV